MPSTNPTYYVGQVEKEQLYQVMRPGVVGNVVEYCQIKI